MLAKDKLVYFILLLVTISSTICGQQTINYSKDSIHKFGADTIHEISIIASRIPEKIIYSPVSTNMLKENEIKHSSAISAFDAAQQMKGIHGIVPGIGFKILNSRGFANTTNVRFSQLVDGVDNQAPHIGAPIGNALGASDPDIEKIELTTGISSALYGLNSTNGMVNIITKNPFVHQGLIIQQSTGINHLGKTDKYSTQLFTVSSIRYAKASRSKLAFKINFSATKGTDWVADNRTDLAAQLNNSAGLTENYNPAFDEVNSYGNESSNRKTLTLGGKNYVVARTGYRESEIDDNTVLNYKGDFGLYYKFFKNNQISLNYKGAFINTVYQRSNRFRLEKYQLHQYSLSFNNRVLAFRTYYTHENTGNSYNIRSLAENMDRNFKSDKVWFNDYTNAFNNSITNGLTINDAHKAARSAADDGRFVPGTELFEQKKKELISINNWDYGAALRVNANLIHAEGFINWDSLLNDAWKKLGLKLLTGFDYRNYIIVPDGNYFINHENSIDNLTFAKYGFFTQLNKEFMKNKLKVGAVIRADKCDYFTWKYNPRLSIVYAPAQEIVFRTSFQSGYRFPSIFEGFSNVNSGGVKRVGGLSIMSNGIFENSFTKSSITKFQETVNTDININGLNVQQAIQKNKELLQKNPYTYLKPEYVKSFECGFRILLLKKKLFIDIDYYKNNYENFIAQMEASVAKTDIKDSIPAFLYDASKQDRYRLWTNSTSKVVVSGLSVGIKYKYNERLSTFCNSTFGKIKTDIKDDGLEDGFNTPQVIINAGINADKLWQTLYAGFAFKYQSKYDYTSFLVNGEVPAFSTIDLHCGFRFKKQGLDIKVAANNLLNKPYYSILGGPQIGAMYFMTLAYELK